MPEDLKRSGWIADKRTDCTYWRERTIDFVPDRRDDSIIIFVGYLPGADQKAMDLDIERAKLEIRGIAQKYGWSSWVRIKEDVSPAK